MFETAQQEPSGGTNKLVAGVIGVVVIALVVVYFVFLQGEPDSTAARPAAAVADRGPANTPVPDAQPMMDLSIQRYNLGRDQTQTMAMWDLVIGNRSREITYRNIQYATNYYDSGDNLIYSNTGTLPGEIGPGEQRTITGINDGLYPLATTRYTIELKGADGFKP